MGSFCIHSRLKEKKIHLRTKGSRKEKQKFTTFLISNLKYTSLLAYIITPHCNSRFGTITFSLPDKLLRQYRLQYFICEVAAILKYAQWFLNRLLLCIAWKVLHTNLFSELAGNHSSKTWTKHFLIARSEAFIGALDRSSYPVYWILQFSRGLGVDLL